MKLNYTFKDINLLNIAITHPSLSKNRDIESYERLEFLGDNVLNLMLAEEIFRKFPNLAEGKLSQIHSNLVKTQTLANIANDLQLGKIIRLDVGEERNNGRLNPNNLENVLEALIGAVYLDSDFNTCKQVFLPWWHEYLSNDNFLMQRDPKSTVQEWAQKQGKGIPQYKITSQEGLPHQKTFTIELSISGYNSVYGYGSSIKNAEIAAATKFLEEQLRERP